MALLALGTDVLCRIDFMLKIGITTVSGLRPLATPYKASVGLVIAAKAITPMS